MQLGAALAVLGVGAVLSYLLGPRITRKWEEGRKKVDIRVDLMERSLGLVEEAIFYGIDLTGNMGYYGVTDEPPKSLNRFLDKFYEKDRSIKMRLRVYTPSLEDDWIMLSGALSAYILSSYRFAFPSGGEEIKEHLDKLQNYVGNEFFPKDAMNELLSSHNDKKWDKVAEGIGKKSSKFLLDLKAIDIEVC